MHWVITMSQTTRAPLSDYAAGGCYSKVGLIQDVANVPKSSSIRMCQALKTANGMYEHCQGVRERRTQGACSWPETNVRLFWASRV